MEEVGCCVIIHIRVEQDVESTQARMIGPAGDGA